MPRLTTYLPILIVLSLAALLIATATTATAQTYTRTEVASTYVERTGESDYTTARPSAEDSYIAAHVELPFAFPYYDQTVHSVYMSCFGAARQRLLDRDVHVCVRPQQQQLRQLDHRVLWAGVRR